VVGVLRKEPLMSELTHLTISQARAKLRGKEISAA
jgi:hypothetical protein